jgi:hypothetical protein
MKNKHADIPIVILVIGVVAICGFAILSFSFNDFFGSALDNLGLGVFEKIHSDVEKFEFYKNIGVSFDEAAKNVGGIFLNNKLVIKNRQDISSKLKIISYEYILDKNI